MKMENPYRNALMTPFFLLGERFVKNETVKGIKGKMLGKSRESKPAPNPIIKILHKLWLTVSSPQGLTGLVMSMLSIFRFLACDTTPPSSFTEKGTVVAG